MLTAGIEIWTGAGKAVAYPENSLKNTAKQPLPAIARSVRVRVRACPSKLHVDTRSATFACIRRARWLRRKAKTTAAHDAMLLWCCLRRDNDGPPPRKRWAALVISTLTCDRKKSHSAEFGVF